MFGTIKLFANMLGEFCFRFKNPWVIKSIKVNEAPKIVKRINTIPVICINFSIPPLKSLSKNRNTIMSSKTTKAKLAKK